VLPGLRAVMPPTGVGAFKSNFIAVNAAVFNTAPCSDTGSSITGLSGNAGSRSSRVKSRGSSMAVMSYP
jgi:hypothetical protein